MLTKYSSPQNAVVGSNFTFQWKYELADADKLKFRRIEWGFVTPSSALRFLASVLPNGVSHISTYWARYKNRITWTGDLSKFVASFVLSNVTSGDEQEYFIEIRIGLFDALKDSVNLKVLGKCSKLIQPKVQATF